MDINEIRRIQSILQQQTPPETQKQSPEGGSFKDVLESLVGDVNNLQKNAEAATQRLVTGDVENIHQVMVAMEEATTSFQLMMEMRNKILDAYREVMRTQI
ncbi:MAG: flagellar hook-basal body complex protein FliE [bacterium]|nr:flagellar hook-basal body complex protein FliE [bacterium]